MLQLLGSTFRSVFLKTGKPGGLQQETREGVRMALDIRREVEAPSMLKARNLFRLSAVMEKEWVVITFLLIWGLVVYYSHLGSPLRGEETKYAEIARKILHSHEWFRLEYDGGPYLNKPPLHFWLMAISMGLLGPSEFAVRLPTATFGFGTMFLVYYCGKVLFHRQIGLVAALITASTLSSVWNGHLVKFDTELGCLMNVAFFALYLAYRGGGRRLGYFCLAFIAMAVGTMLKGPVAVLLPGVAGFAFLVITRRSKAFREIPLFVFGLAILLLLAGPYYWRLGKTFNQHFFVTENLMRVLHQRSAPAVFYVYMIFAEFFPWSLFLPCVGAYLWMSRSRHLSEEEVLLRVWAIGFFLLLSLPAFKIERFLVWIIPPFALLTARYWDRFITPSEPVHPVEDRLLRLTSALLALGIVVALFAGPLVFRARYSIPTNFWPAPFALLIGLCCLALLYNALRRGPRGIFLGVWAVAMALTLGLVQVFYPALARYDSAKPISEQVRAIVGDSPVVMQIPDWTFRVEFLYYLDRPDAVLRLDTADEIYAAFRPVRQVFGLVTRDRYEELERRGDVPLARLADYTHRRRDYVLVGKPHRS
jgi:4-amino-4-deoxy-L-arabinose transferase-like glycosyltransferase